jgi:hypothetical protein
MEDLSGEASTFTEVTVGKLAKTDGKCEKAKSIAPGAKRNLFRKS